MKLSLEGAQASFISYDRLVISLKGGELYVLTLYADSMRSVRNFHFEKAAASVLTTCVCIIPSLLVSEIWLCNARCYVVEVELVVCVLYQLYVWPSYIWFSNHCITIYCRLVCVRKITCFLDPGWATHCCSDSQRRSRARCLHWRRNHMLLSLTSQPRRNDWTH